MPTVALAVNQKKTSSASDAIPSPAAAVGVHIRYR
jgi:hypothetical protein